MISHETLQEVVSYLAVASCLIRMASASPCAVILTCSLSASESTISLRFIARAGAANSALFCASTCVCHVDENQLLKPPKL